MKEKSQDSGESPVKVVFGGGLSFGLWLIFLQSMEAGAPGHHGTSVLSPAEEGHRSMLDSATTHAKFGRQGLVGDVAETQICSASRTVPLVSHTGQAAQDKTT